MSSSIYAKPNPSPAVTRRPPISNDDTAYNTQRTPNRRSLSDKLRGLFRRDSVSPKRTTSTDRRSVTTAPVRQTSSSPNPNMASTEAPHLRTPIISWPFGKRKTKISATSSTPTASKTKAKKDNRKKNQNTVPPLQISSPIYPEQNQTSLQGGTFGRRSPEHIHDSIGRIQSSTSYETTPPRGYRDYVVLDQTQQNTQVITPNNNDFIPLTNRSDRSRSPSMNRQRIPNTNDYYFHQDRSTPTLTIPMADVEVMSTPQRRRNVGDTVPITNTQILTEKPPMFPQTSSRPPSAVPSNNITNPTQIKSTSSPALNDARSHPSPSPSRDADVPKLHAPIIPFGSTSSKKKAKRTKSKTRADGMTSSSSTINNMVQQNPLRPYDSGSSIYRSLPDAEIISGSSILSKKSSKSRADRYPGLSAIVLHHLHPSTAIYPDQSRRPILPTTTTPQRAQRFETSTTTLNENERDISWSRQHPSDGHIRPMTPQKTTGHPDISVTRLNADDLRDRTPSRRDSPQPPPIYRSSTTVYARDKNDQFGNGEIRTWSSQQNDINNTDRYDNKVTPPKTKDTQDEHRYSPRANEQKYYEKHQQISTGSEQESQGEEEERYEVSFEYQSHHQQYSYETNKHYDELNLNNRYTTDIGGDNNYNYLNLTSTVRSSNLNEQEQIYDQASRSYISGGRIQETHHNSGAPVNNVALIPRTYTLKRSADYNGLGILLSADSQTRLNHFIREVEPGSPAHQAGLRRNDRIISINNINVENIEFNNVLVLIKEGLEKNNLQITVIHEPEHI